MGRTMITAFLSLSGDDKTFVEQVHSRLPDGLAYYYPCSFTNGENLIRAMEDRVGQATIFVLFASRASAKSHWVKFEIDRARIQAITKSDFRVLVFPIDRELQRGDLPPWMSEYWIPNAGQTTRDVARYIRNAIMLHGILSLPTGKGYGRGEFTDSAVQLLTQTIVDTGTTPNVLIFAGFNGIGRRTAARQFLEQGFPAARDLVLGPEFTLPQFADLEDMYRALRQEIDPSFSMERFASELEVFRNLDMENRVSEICNNLKHFFDLGQAVFAVTRNGIFEDRGVLKTWVPPLFERLASQTTGKLCIISNRLAHENEMRRHPNVLQFAVPPLKDADIKSIIVAMLPVFGASPVLPNEDTIRAIGGHPAIAKMASKLIAQQGPTIFADDPSGLFHIQDDVLRESLDVRSLSDIEGEVLSVLSWLPQLPGDTLAEIFTSRHAIDRKTFAERISGLILCCLITPVGDNMLISPAVRAFFRRNYGYGSPELRKTLFTYLKDEWERSHRNEQTRVELFDAFVFMCALEGGTLPPEFSQLLLSSTLQELIRETYDADHESRASLQRVVTWGQPAFTMRMDETTREEILSYVARALIRLGKRDGEVDSLLALFQKKGYRSYHYINGFYLRRRNHPDAAIINFIEARKVRKYMRSVVGELAECYKALGRWQPLRDLIREQAAYIDRNPNLLDIYAGMLIAERNWPDAEAVIHRLRVAAKDEGRAECRTASLMMQKDGNFNGAVALLGRVLSTVQKGRDNVRRMRALAAAYAGQLDIARSDVEFLKTRITDAFSVGRIEAAILSAEGRFDEALEQISSLPQLFAQDYLLKARILDAKAANILTPLFERDALRQEAAALRARYGIVDEFDVD